MACRKVIVVVVGVFGQLTDIQTQVHIALLVIAGFLLLHITMEPFPKETGGQRVGMLETFALSVCFMTLWCGLLFYHGTNILATILSIFLVTINVVFLLVALKLFWNPSSEDIWEK